MSKEMLEEINEILNESEKKKRIDNIIPLLHGKWELPLMLELCRVDSLRFSDCKKRFPNITNSVLTSALRNLEKWGLVSRIQFNEIPPHVEYSCTEKGKKFLPVYYAIFKWALENDLNNDESNNNE